MMESNFLNTPEFLEDSELVEVLLPLNKVLQVIPAGRSTIYEWISKGLFPAPVRIGPRRVAWRQSDITRFISEKSLETE